MYIEETPVERYCQHHYQWFPICLSANSMQMLITQKDLISKIKDSSDFINQNQNP